MWLFVVFRSWSFNSRARDELFNVAEFATLLEAQVIVETWRIEHNNYRPHFSLVDLTPCRVRGHLDRQHPTSTLTKGGPVHGVPPL